MWDRMRKRRFRVSFLALAGVVLAVLLFVQGLGPSSSDNDDADRYECASVAFVVEDAPASTDAATLLSQTSYQGLGSDVQAIASTFALLPASSDITAFSLLDDGETLELSDAAREGIETAMADMDAEVAFTIIDAQTGEGIQCNADRLLYGASSAKAWFSLFLAQLVDAKAISWDDAVFCQATDYPLSDEWNGQSCVGSLLENTLLYSDNGAYEALREAYEGMGYAQWLADLGIDGRIVADTSRFPFLTSAASAQMWATIYSYVSSDAENAAWLEQLLSNTQVSFLRDALGNDGQTIVINKAGWDSASSYAGYPLYLDALCDSGVVQKDGHAYIVSVLANVGESRENAEKVEALIEALFQAMQ